MDTFEKWIQTHRDALDGALPPERIWKKLHQRLDKQAIEAFVREHRAAFDHEPPTDKVWSSISQELDHHLMEQFVLSHQSDLGQVSPSPDLWSSISQKLDENEIEEFVLSYKSTIDQLTPTPDTWLKIEKQLPKVGANHERTMPLRPTYQMWIQRIAVAASFFVLGLIVQYLVQSRNDQFSEPIMTSSEPISELDTEHVKAEKYYLSQIKIQVNQIKKFDIYDQELNDDFIEQIKILNQAYNELKNEIAKGRPVDLLAYSIIQNLQMQVNILNKQIDLLNKIKNTEKNQTDVQI